MKKSSFPILFAIVVSVLIMPLKVLGDLGPVYPPPEHDKIMSCVKSSLESIDPGQEAYTYGWTTVIKNKDYKYNGQFGDGYDTGGAFFIDLNKVNAKEEFNTLFWDRTDVPNMKKERFHGYKAVWDKSEYGSTYAWLAGNYLFEVNIMSGYSLEKVRNILYNNAVNHGLISDQKGQQDQTPTQDTTASKQSGPAIAVIRSPRFFKELNDEVSITLTLKDGQGNKASAKTVTLTNQNTGKVQKTKTNSEGSAAFTVRHTDEKSKFYRYKVQGMNLEKTIEIPVVTMDIQLETNPVTGKPYTGIVADGSSSIEINLNLGSLESEEIEYSKPSFGKLEGDALFGGQITLKDGSAVIKYAPPKYINEKMLIEKSNSLNIWRVQDKINFKYTDAKGGKMQFELAIDIYRPPVMLVHGFTGDKTTWADLDRFLRDEKYDTHIGEYFVLDQSIQSQSSLLGQSMRHKNAIYQKNGIKPGKADVVAHSMGGLISRYYISKSVQFNNNIRKLIMVGTPNHGCSWIDLQTGKVQAWLGARHEAAARQLYSKSPFMIDLNKGEDLGYHLNPKVQYGNIYSYSAYPPFFEGDVVVSASSAYLNGVASKRLRGFTHASTFSSLSTPITQSTKVFNQIVKWLQKDIFRPNLDNTQINVSRAEGEVYIKPWNIGSRTEEQINPSDANTKAAKIDSWDDVYTKEGKAMVRLMNNNTPWGYIRLDKNTHITLGHVSPSLIEVKITSGKARFTTFKLFGKGHFTVNVTPENGLLHTITGLDTDFAITAANQSHVHVLNGKVHATTSSDSSSMVDSTVESGNSITIDSSAKINKSTASYNPWWDDDFYKLSAKDWINTYKDIAKDLFKRLTTGRWKIPDFSEYSGTDYAVAGIIVIIAVILLIFVSRKSRLWHVLLSFVYVIALAVFVVRSFGPGPVPENMESLNTGADYHSSSEKGDQSDTGTRQNEHSDPASSEDNSEAKENLKKIQMSAEDTVRYYYDNILSGEYEKIKNILFKLPKGGFDAKQYENTYAYLKDYNILDSDVAALKAVVILESESHLPDGRIKMRKEEFHLKKRAGLWYLDGIKWKDVRVKKYPNRT